jgi:hypothetical protein
LDYNVGLYNGKMGDKRYKRQCGNNCMDCWRNRLKHGNHAKTRRKNKNIKIYNRTIVPFNGITIKLPPNIN